MRERAVRMVREAIAESGERVGAVTRVARLPGTCWDNAVAESFFATLKKELVYMHAWPSRRFSSKCDLRLYRGLVQPRTPSFHTQLFQSERI
jgi:transposase InsO family protein